jgi:hypothetical protein
MHLERRSFIRALVSGAAFSLAAGCGGVTAAPGGEPMGAAREVQVDLFRGLADIFSRGMDALTDKLNQEGYRARVYSTNGWQTAAQRIADQYTRGRQPIIVLIGHSLGANATFDVASQLDRQNIPVELIVTFDATSPQPVPKNVLHLVNLFQQNGLGKQVTAGSGFKGELSNIDLTADTGLSHTTIEKSPRLHALVMRKIQDIVEADLTKRVKSKKRKVQKPKPA